MDPSHGVDSQHGVDPQERELFRMINENEDVTKTFLNESGQGDESLNVGDGSGEVDTEAWNGEEDDEGDADEGEADEGEADGSGRTLNLGNSGEVYIYICITVIEMQLSIYIYTCMY